MTQHLVLWPEKCNAPFPVKAIFRDRREAGVKLAGKLQALGDKKPYVLALPRGGVPVAAEVARSLRAPLDVLVVRKIGMPGNRELGIGAIAEDDVLWIDSAAAAGMNIDPSELEEELKHELVRVSRQVRKYRGDRAPADLDGRMVIIVDDGIATGVTMRAACKLARARGAAEVVVAVPVGSPSACEFLSDDADGVVCGETPDPFFSVSQWYEDFSQVSDEQVLEILRRYAAPVEVLEIESRDVSVHGLPGTLRVPYPALGVVIFAHGSGSSRVSPRNRRVAEELSRAGLVTLLFDLLTEEEARSREKAFEIPLLSERLAGAVEWLRMQPEARGLPLGFFGASTGAAAALAAAARLGSSISAVASRGGRPDLAGDWLGSVNSPTLLIVGGDDPTVLKLNRAAIAALRGTEAELAIVPGASHLFEEPGALEAVASHAAQWFTRWFEKRRLPSEAA